MERTEDRTVAELVDLIRAATDGVEKSLMGLAQADPPNAAALFATRNLAIIDQHVKELEGIANDRAQALIQLAKWSRESAQSIRELFKRPGLAISQPK